MAEIKEAYPDASVQLIESSGGAFEVRAGGELVFSKLSLGRHAESGEVLGLLRQHFGD